MEVSGHKTDVEDQVSGRKKTVNDKAKVKTDYYRQNVCQPCQEENDTQEAYGCCITCGENLCVTCFKYHLRPKPFKNHLLVVHKYLTTKNISSPPPFQEKKETLVNLLERSKSETNLKQIQDKHFHLNQVKEDKALNDEEFSKTENVVENLPPPLPEKRKNFISDGEFSKTKNVVENLPPPVPERRKKFTTKCSIHPAEDLKHHCRNHKTIVCSVCALKEHKQCTKVDYIHEIFETERKRIIKKVSYVKDKAAYITKKVDDAYQISNEEYEKALSDVCSHRESVNKYFDEIENRLHTEFKISCEDISKRKIQLHEISDKLRKKVELLSDTKSGSEIERYLSMKEEESNVDVMNKELKGVFGQSRLHVSYEAQYSMADLGKLELEKPGDASSQKLTLLKRINVSMKEEPCSVIDIAIPSNDSFPILLTDSLNDRVIVICNEESTKFHPIDAKPWGITYISDNTPIGEIAVACPENNTVIFYEVDKITLKRRKTINLDTPTGIRYYSPDCLVIVAVCAQLAGETQENAKVQVLSVEGYFLRTIACFNYLIHHIDIANDGRIIILSGRKHCLCMLDLNSKALDSFYFLDDDMKGPYGLASGKSQSIYVCGYECLRIVSKEGKWENILTKDDKFCPQSVHVCNRTNRLFVGQAKPSHELLIFRL